MKNISLILILLSITINHIDSKQYDSPLNYYIDIDSMLLNNYEVDSSKKVTNIFIDNSIGSLSRIIESINTDDLTYIRIESSSINDTLLDLSNIKEGSLSLRISNSSFDTEIKNLKAIKHLFILNSYVNPINVSKLSPNILSINLLYCSPLLLTNIDNLKNLENLVQLGLLYTSTENRTLNLRNNNKLKSLVLSNILSLPNISKQLDLESLSLTRIYDYNLDSLKKLISTNKKLESLHLDELNLSDNFKIDIELDSLKSLNLAKNNFTKFPNEILEFDNLEFVFLSYNKISDFDYSLFKNMNLIQVDIKYNRLKEPIKQPKDRRIIINQEGNPFVE